MSDVMWQGLGLSVMGMGLTFAALALIVLVMVVLQRLFSPQQPALDGSETKEALTVRTPAQATEEEEVVAAIATALAHFGWPGTDGGQLGTALEVQRGRWWTMARTHQHVKRIPRVHGRRRR